MKPLAFLVLLLAGPAGAADMTLPALFDVAGVGGGDQLNVRAAPSAAAPIIGSLAADAKGVEVIALDSTGRWGRVNTAERAGWAAMRYLAPQPASRAPGVPAGLACFGTEPFWTLRPAGAAAVFATPDGGEERLRLEAALGTGIAGDARRALIAAGAGRRITATILPGLCSDNMSDLLYGLVATLVVEGEKEPAMLTGCCSLAR